MTALELPPRYRKINGQWYVLSTYMGERMIRAMEIARHEGMIEGARVRAEMAKQKAGVAQ